jgi:hypothetical protein
VWLSSIKSSDLDLLHSKYKGKTLAIVVVDEASELPFENFIGLQERLSQSKKPDGTPYRYPLQFVLVTNAVDEDHWIAREFPADGISPLSGRRTIRVALYDNARNLGPDVMMGFERRYPPGHSLRRTVIEGLRGLTMIGKPVYDGAFQRPTHVSPQVAYTPYYPLLEGWDFGQEKPAVVWAQFIAHTGAVRVLGWVKGSNLFLETFAPKVLELRRRLFPGVADVWTWADPTGAIGNQGMSHTAIKLLQALGVPARINTKANDAATRHAAIQVTAGFMERVCTDGSPAFQMVPRGYELIKNGALLEEHPSDLMVTAFEAGYVWDDHAAPISDPNIRRPKKGTRYDDLMNAWEYIAIGEQFTVPQALEMARADKQVAAMAQRVAYAAIAATHRQVGPTGETLQQVETRIAQTLKHTKDRDPADRHAAQGRRGGW